MSFVAYHLSCWGILADPNSIAAALAKWANWVCFNYDISNSAFVAGFSQI